MSTKVMGLKVWHWLVIAIIVASGLGYISLPYLGSGWLSTGDGNGDQGPQPGEEIYYGACDFRFIYTDYFAGTDATGSSTNEAASLFHTKPGSGVAGTAISVHATTSTSAEILEGDDGYVWFYFYGGDDYYFLDDVFVNSNERVVEHQWSDYDNDGTDEFIFKAWVGDVGKRGQGLTPVCVFAAVGVDEDDGTISDDNPADITGVGEVSGTVTAITWKFSGIAAEDAYYIGRLYVATNDTRGGDDVRCAELTLSGGWTIGGQTSWGAPVSEANGDYEAWYFTGGDDYTEPHNAIPVWRGTNAADAMYLTLNVKTYYETSDEVEFTIYIDFVQPDGNIDTDSDGVNINEA
jgi:hypothetical protein